MKSKKNEKKKKKDYRPIHKETAKIVRIDFPRTG